MSLVAIALALGSLLPADLPAFDSEAATPTATTPAPSEAAAVALDPGANNEPTSGASED